MEYSGDVFHTFLDLDSVIYSAVNGTVTKYFNLCSEDEQSFYGFGTTCGYVINDKIIIMGWSIPLNGIGPSICKFA